MSTNTEQQEQIIDDVNDSKLETKTINEQIREQMSELLLWMEQLKQQRNEDDAADQQALVSALTTVEHEKILLKLQNLAATSAIETLTSENNKLNQECTQLKAKIDALHHSLESNIADLGKAIQDNGVDSQMKHDLYVKALNSAAEEKAKYASLQTEYNGFKQSYFGTINNTSQELKDQLKDLSPIIATLSQDLKKAAKQTLHLSKYQVVLIHMTAVASLLSIAFLSYIIWANIQNKELNRVKIKSNALVKS